MELKLGMNCKPVRAENLLIVPYGIETELLAEIQSFFPCLLIVPYGIET